jgi:beta-N-acetylhexosaminidase
VTPSAAAELVTAGFEGRTAAEAPLAELTALAPGAIVLFARNVGRPDELRELVAALRATQPLPPLIAIDQEGGRVARITDGVAALPPAMAVGAAGDVDACARIGRLVGRDLARLGISVDYAPVGDCAVDPENTVIGSRAYGGDPERVASYAGAFARGLTSGGVAAAIKHFPGHGATAVDSHLALPHVVADEALLRARDLVPFAAAIAAGVVPIVMTAHVVVDALDAERPATLSPRILTGLLREELGFRGVIATDCLQMEAIARAPGTVAAGVAALAAGADLLTVSHSLALAREVAAAVAAAADEGRLASARVGEARSRVRALRERYAQLAPFADPLDEGEPARIAGRAVTLVRGDMRLRLDRPVTVISFEGTAFDGAGGARATQPSLSAALRARRLRSEVMRVPLAPDADDVDLLVALVPSLGDRNFVAVVRRARLHAAQRAAVERLLAAAPEAIVIAAAEPWDAFAFPAARNVACTYGDDALMFEACADALCGRAEPLGRLPVDADVALR